MFNERFEKVFEIVLKKIHLVVFLSIITACKPVSETAIKTDVHDVIAQCIGSQSQCEFITDLTTIRVKFSQQQISDKIITELPFFIELSQFTQQDTHSNITNISAYLEGRDMFMGKVPVFFKKTGNESIYLAQSLLANCMEEQMVWRLWITLKVAEKTQTLFVDFTSHGL